MECEERPEEVAKYAERREGDVFEVMAYSGEVKVRRECAETKLNLHPKLSIYQRALIIPLPPDFSWEKLSNLDPSKPNLPDSILIMEDKERWRWKGKKRIKPLTAFLDKPGRTSVKLVKWIGKFSDRTKVWITKEKFMKITKRNLYVDKYYADQIFDRGIKNLER